MDPILDEMKRVKDPHDIKGSRFRDWVQYLCALVAAKNDEIATLKGQIERAQMAEMTADEIRTAAAKRAARKEPAHVG